ncbi:chain length determinant protein tyrosine kinase EpsG [Pseudoduganella lurida]|uniref:Chain length determinant protein tyrosine kinase EpsG n=1 Tax=Pseudoduganella lurida TaxID=1036180 RepID=A0A562R7U7_9BURK|nr:chain length determinant protein tyrosine kinase EpsG [Pseudoduganella lurida]TWI65148.1 chain length determinant protein tyrosine kinase EpsG [Pseudoduganella lurida]
MNHPLPINSAAAKPVGSDSSIGALLLESGKITPEGAERVLRSQKELGIRFGEAAQRLGLITEADIQQVLARQFDYPYLTPGESKLSPKLVAAFQPFSHQVEMLRAVRSQVMLRWFARGHKSLAIVGVEPGDGASLFAANLAVVFSQLGENTLLVDANLRTPTQHENFDIKGRQGLSDILAGRGETSVATKVPSLLSLTVLPAGTLPPNPLELLSRSAFGALKLQLEAAHDIVLYDAPAFATASDALPLAARTGGVLIVVRKNHTSLDNVASLTDQVTQSGAQVVGSVLVDF